MLRVVLADDENKVILLMQKLIDWEALGYEIAGTANDGLRALELVREKQPHLLITDVRMPGCDGIELIQRAKALQPKLHFIVISGYRKFEYAQNALKYGVEDYLLKPLKQEELTGILLRLKEKMGQEAALEFQLKRSGEHQQELLLDALLGTAERGTSFLSAGQANGEYGFHFGSGTYAAAVIRVDVPDAESYQDGYRILLRHALEIVRRESGLLTEEFAASLGHAGIAVLLYLRAYHAVEVTQCFTKIRKEIENQRDLFWNVQATVCLGSRRDSLEQAGESMREALWLCRDRLCRPQSWRDAALEMPDLARRYQMDASRKKSFQVAAECLDEVRFVQELEESCRTVEALPDLNGQMVEDWFRQVLEACLYGMRQSGETEAPLEEEMDKRFWHCTDMAAVYRLLRQGIQAEIQRLKEAKALREMRRELVVFWIINRHRDSIELLHSFQEVFTDVPIHVCRNLYFGEARRFDLYNTSKAREAVEKNGRTLDFPAVGNRVADWLYSRRMSIRAAQPEMPFGTRAELQRWRGVCAKMFDSVMGEAS